MNRIIVKAFALMAFVLMSMTAAAQSTPFDKYSDVDDVVYVYISKAMLGMFGSKMLPATVDGVNISGIMDRLNGIQIVSSTNKKMKKELKDDALSIVKKEKYDILLQVSEQDSKVDMYFKEGKKSSVIVMINDNQVNTVVVAFSGTFSMDDVTKMMQPDK